MAITPAGGGGIGGGGATGNAGPAALLVDEKASGQNGGTATSGAWETRTLNTTKYDTIGGTALTANQFTIGPGTFDIDATAPTNLPNNAALRLRNITDGSTALVGVNGYGDAPNSGTTIMRLIGRITLAAPKVFALQQRVGATWANTGNGGANSFGEVETYAQVLIRKVA